MFCNLQWNTFTKLPSQHNKDNQGCFICPCKANLSLSSALLCTAFSFIDRIFTLLGQIYRLSCKSEFSSQISIIWKMSPNLGRKKFKIVLSFATFLSGSLSQAFNCSHRLKICNVRLLTHSVMCVRLGHFEPRGKHTKELRVLRVSVGWWEKLSKDTCYCLHWGIPHKLWLFTREICVCVCVCMSVREGMLTRLQPLSLWLFGLTEGEQMQNEVWK